MKIAVVVSSPMTVRVFLRDQIAALATNYEVTVVANFRDTEELGVLPASVRLQSIDIRRRASPMADLRALFALWRFLRKQGFMLIHSVTPKAGLLSMLAGFVAGVPVRLHTFTGQVWATKSGFGRRFYRFLDAQIFRFSTRCFVDSQSQRDFLLREKVVDAKRSTVLASGSISGVDITRFSASEHARSTIRSDLGISTDDFVCLFLGRLNREKGVLDLARAFISLDKGEVSSVLLIVGPDESGIRQQIESLNRDRRSRILFVDFTDRPQDYMNAADLFCLPSYREGFGSVVIEAGAVGIPALASDIYGVSDAIVDGVTGILHRVRDVEDLGQKLRALRDDPARRRVMGHAASARAREQYAKEIVTSAIVREYATLLEKGAA
ncbi:MAG: glycosyltransferase family 4 protein [Gammaproteobacteria bacterium]|nr:glycosyltransferase family 4 protein [Gammaproteobacteria bacterium]